MSIIAVAGDNTFLVQCMARRRAMNTRSPSCKGNDDKVEEVPKYQDDNQDDAKEEETSSGADNLQEEVILNELMPRNVKPHIRVSNPNTKGHMQILFNLCSLSQ